MINYNIIDLIPQRPPMVMIDQLELCTIDITITNFTIKADNIFCKDGLFNEPGLIENIAQTAAARAGYIAKQKNEEPVVGFIGSVKRLKINTLPKVGSQITTSVESLHDIGNVSIVKGVIKQNNEVIAECEMNIFLEE
ncbi:MAG: hydroxymyristoyl-ACP dehydratase [Bacteroidales bacterium]|nr:hydroxymyristoyl-ACP dehydratase [Bacteroidales bacterium]